MEEQLILCPDHQSPLAVKIDGWAEGARRFRCCPKCLGFWFDRNDLNYLHITEEMLNERRLLKRGFESQSVRACPCCHEFSMLVKKERGVEIDICSKCGGIWLDAGELTRLTDMKSWVIARPKPISKDQSEYADFYGMRGMAKFTGLEGMTKAVVQLLLSLI